jgi:hypothetical protein
VGLTNQKNTKRANDDKNGEDDHIVLRASVLRVLFHDLSLDSILSSKD